MTRETSYLGTLESATSWSITGAQLIIVSSDGTKLVFAAGGTVAPSPTPAPSVPTSGIVGRTWKLTTFAGTDVGAFFTVTLTFGSNGGITGNGGCNDYTADYTLVGEKLTISNAVLGTETCPDKPGSDSMEQGVITVMPYLDSAKLAGDQLTLGSSIAGVEMVFEIAP